MDNKGVSPVISMVLIIGLSVALFSFSATQFLDVSETNTEYSNSEVEFEELSGQNGVEVRLTQERGDSEVYLDTPKDRVKLKDAGQITSAKDGAGTYSVVSVKDGESYLLESTVIDSKSSPTPTPTFGLQAESAKVNSGNIDVNLERTKGSSEVKFESFEIKSKSADGNIGPADEVELEDGKHSSVSFGTEYDFDNKVSYKNGEIKYTIKNPDTIPSSVAISPKNKYDDIEVTLTTRGGDDVNFALTKDTFVLLESNSPYGNIQDEESIIGEQNVTVDGKIQETNDFVDLGDNTTVDDKVQEIGNDLMLGKNSTLEDKIQNVDGSTELGVNTTVDNQIQDIEDSLTIGENSSVGGKVQNTGDLTFGDDIETDDKIQNVGDLTSGENLTVDDKIQTAGDISLGDESYIGDEVADSGDLNLGDNVEIDGDIENVGNVTSGKNLTVGDKISKTKDIDIGRNSSVDGAIEDTGDVVIDKNSSIGGKVQNVDKLTLGGEGNIQDKIDIGSGKVDIGSDSVIEGQVESATSLIVRSDSTMESTVKSSVGSVKAYSGVVFESDVKGGKVDCPDGSGTVTFKKKGSCKPNNGNP